MLNSPPERSTHAARMPAASAPMSSNGVEETRTTYPTDNRTSGLSTNAMSGRGPDGCNDPQISHRDRAHATGIVMALC